MYEEGYVLKHPTECRPWIQTGRHNLASEASLFSMLMYMWIRLVPGGGREPMLHEKLSYIARMSSVAPCYLLVVLSGYSKAEVCNVVHE